MRKILIGLILLTGVVSCSKEGSGDALPTPPPLDHVGKPTSSQLSSPANNTLCLTADLVSATQSAVTFTWAKADNTDAYELHVKDLISGEELVKTTDESTLKVELDVNRPYSWYVVSTSKKLSEVAKSLTWKFYNAGPAVENYAPFPASDLSPALGESVTAVDGKISFSWTGKDVDNDIQDYDVYLGQDISSMALLQGGLSEMALKDVAMQPGVYYWQVVTRDKAGNVSQTAVYSFSVK